MSSPMEVNELHSGQNKTSEITQPPADKFTRRIVEQAASLVSKKGLEFENAHHAYYKHKLAEYCAPNQNRDPDDDSVDYEGFLEPEDHLRSLEIFDTPPHVRINTLIERTALLVAQNGSEFESTVMNRTADDPRFNFLNILDPDHEFYSSKLRHYSSKYPGRRAQRLNVVSNALCVLPECVRPKGMKLTELDTIRMTKPHFHQFLKPTDRWFPFFKEVVASCSQVWKPPKDLNEDLRKNPDQMDSIFKDLFLFTRFHEINIKLDSRAKIYFANKELPPTVEQKFDELALVPGQFLAQHPV
ncbi:probable splicing factor 3A subunit 1 [Eutrema salsugineum]|uniref:probable splicing factor 3A subunit 1 n=1 Tax=Eutrema salsugineum TaxID=72664 RepID=UPI000CED2D49|nr:probable splicing factor 3A subunit 1 [Eutrema salsugineum]